MTTLRDLLLELRAVRIGIELWLQTTTGARISLLELAEKTDVRSYTFERPKPRDHKSIIHRDDQAARARETLAEMGDDTLAMIDYVRREISPEAAEGMQRFYEEEIVGRR